MSNVTPLRPADDPDTVLDRAKGQYSEVVVIGYNHEGELEVRSTTDTDHKEVLWLLGLFKHKLLNGDYFEE